MFHACEISIIYGLHHSNIVPNAIAEPKEDHNDEAVRHDRRDCDGDMYKGIPDSDACQGQRNGKERHPVHHGRGVRERIP